MTSKTQEYDIPYYKDFIAPAFIEEALKTMEDVPGIEGLKVQANLRQRFGHIETQQALQFVCTLYQKVSNDLNKVLDQRAIDRAFIDQQTKECVRANSASGIDYLSAEYKTAIGRKDDNGRIVMGPLETKCEADWKVEIPEFLQGEQVTLFGPPDTKRMSINAMNAIHRKLPNEPDIIARLIEETNEFPKWGADNEDSKTPLMSDFLLACENLIECFNGELKFNDERSGKQYRLEKERLSQPIKRFPGLAIPDNAHILNGSPLPLHIYDFAMHMFHNWDKPKALCFYVPKLENEEEAAYLQSMINICEKMLKELHPKYEMGQVKLYIVFEGPRAIFRIREIAKALRPYFVGGSLGWHDFLAATARFLKHDPNYRIPVKADPNIVIKHIRESHKILERSLAPLGAIKLGGMYGVLYENGNKESFQISMIGYIKDVVTQLKRNLDGFWVAHPDFVRIGLALVQAYRRKEKDSSDSALKEVICGLITDPEDQKSLMAFVEGDDIEGLDESDPMYLRGVIAASLKESDVIKNNDPEEVRYNIFQALQYIADWLGGNGCVALPATLRDRNGKEIRVRIMDDLATTERSRWEVWAEIHHGRISMEEFERILAEEIQFIKEDQNSPTRQVQVKWSGEAEKWYPIAIKILRKLMTDTRPVEFVPELLLPFLLDFIREAKDPWAQAQKYAPEKYC